jgi:DNA-binding PadR family transcriptional regulator
MSKKLTHRQQQFLGQFLDIYQETDRPVHYVTIAERLHLGKVTVYEMLRLLEERGLVRAEYEVDSSPHGPGRPTILFQPTEEARRAINQLAGDSAEVNDWQMVKEHILQKLREGKADGYEELVTALLARIPERRSPLIFVTELITAVIITLATIPDAPQIHTILERLGRIGLPQEIGLSALSGIGFVLSALERINRRTATVLLAQIGKYEDMLSQLSEENRHRLSEFAREVTRILSN